MAYLYKNKKYLIKKLYEDLDTLSELEKVDVTRPKHYFTGMVRGRYENSKFVIEKMEFVKPSDNIPENG